MVSIIGYEYRKDRDGTEIYISNVSNRIFPGEAAALMDFYIRMVNYAMTKPLGDPIHEVITGREGREL